jgi:hypothetical protein
MAAAAELHGDPSFGVSPELVLVDAALSAEVRHLLVLPEDTIERLLKDRSGSRPEAVAPLAEVAHDGTADDGAADSQSLAATSDGDPAEPHAAHRREEAPAEEWKDLMNDLSSALTVIEHPHPEQVEHANNSYPILPSPSPEGARLDATETVLRLIAGTS